MWSTRVYTRGLEHVIVSSSRRYHDISRPISTVAVNCSISTGGSDFDRRHGRQHQYHAEGHHKLSVRWSSSSSSGSNNRRFDLQALPFSVSPEEALEKFRKWAEDDQGLRYLMNYKSVRIGAAYVPVWSFDLNVRFKGAGSWKPDMFKIYDEKAVQSMIYIPGLSSYAGYSYRRSVINPVHSTSLVFMGDRTEPFGGWMLKDMKLQASGNMVSVIPDAWCSTQGRAFSVVKEDLQDIVNSEWPRDEGSAPKVQTEVVSSRRVFMPTFVVEYKILGLEYKAYISGCDRSAPVGGVSHQLFGDNNMFNNPEFHQSSRNFLTQVSSGATQLLRRFNLPMLIWIFRPLLTVFWFVLLRLFSAFPVIGAAGGMFAGFRKIVQPWMDERRANAEWERQRVHESEMTEDLDMRATNDFEDVSNSAQIYFNRNRQQILRSLSGEYDHGEGDYDWYADWQAWARQQWEKQASQQQQQAYQQTYQQQYQRQQQQYQQQQQRVSKPKDEYKWPFNPNDPYSVLGVSRNATDKEVSNAFRKEMLKYHPDTQPNASDAQKRRSTERSKLISEAYRKIKAERKQGKR